MHRSRFSKLLCSAAGSALLPIMALTPATAFAQDDDADGEPVISSFLEEVVVTAVAAVGGTKLETSVSTSSLSTDQIEKFAPRSTAEIFRQIPGIRSESSGGGGNANIQVRGLPVSTGGAKFLQLQEDGLPVLQFGDIAFGNADNFLRADYSVQRVEAIRGGSASTFAQNSPGGVINLISRTGDDAGGTVGITRGVDFDTTRVDFEYGGPLADEWNFHVGGFYRIGEGPRDAGYNGDNGGQVKANLTRNFDNGYARLYFKHLNDRAITYLPVPVMVTGTDDNPNFDALPGFDPAKDTPHTPFLLTNFGIGGDGNLRTQDVSDGIRAITTAIGLEFSFDFADDWTVTNKARYADNKGGFVSPFPASVGTADEIAGIVANGPAATAAGANPVGASLVFANGPSAGGAFPGSNPSGLAMTVALFDVDVNDFGLFANDLQLRRTFEVGNGGEATITLGYYKSTQSIDMDWVWNSYVFEVNGKDGALLDVVDGDGLVLTDNGLFDYGDPFGGCCHRSYDASYNTDAPYASIFLEFDRFNIDGSIRLTYGDASGNFAGTVNSAFDVNNDGMLSVPELSVSFIDNANQMPVNYTYDYVSWSVGSNFLVNDDLAVFARVSRGASANAERLLFGPSILPDGSLASEDAAIDKVLQVETGVKYKSSFGLDLFVTGFYAEAEETNFEATTQLFFDRDYQAYGVEVEGYYGTGPLDLNFSFTWTDAEISADAISPANEGNTPRRQASLTYQVTPSYTNDDWGFTLGANVVGTTSSFAQDSNMLKLPGFAQVNLFALYNITDELVLSVNVNNLFDTFGFTESEEGAIPANGLIRARTINGRTTSVSLRFSF